LKSTIKFFPPAPPPPPPPPLHPNTSARHTPLSHFISLSPKIQIEELRSQVSELSSELENFKYENQSLAKRLEDNEEIRTRLEVEALQMADELDVARFSSFSLRPSQHSLLNPSLSFCLSPRLSSDTETKLKSSLKLRQLSRNIKRRWKE
jgi:hypothetical protein